MHALIPLFLVTSGFLTPAFGQLETIGLTTSGVTPTTTSTSLSSTVISTSSSSSTTSSTSSTLTTTSSSATITEDPLVLTTIFTQPSGCAGGMTQIPAWSTELWQNVINPVPTMTLSSCYPSQFYYSAVATTILPPFKQLVCPKDWEAYNVTDTYIVCCPYDYEVYLPNYHNPTRPGLGAVCSSSIWPNVLMDVTSYDAAGSSTVTFTSAGYNGPIVFATAFDGTLATAVVSSMPSTSTYMSTTSTSTSTSPSGATSTSSSQSRTATTASGTARMLPVAPMWLLFFWLLILCFCYRGCCH
ncbi:hypothetical protein AbraIFM66950_010583 [Aspergillus brasiliensis]|nr:hypothetical protein AbraIFM66950_010583 [Aspergillus brasiliensis]